MPREDTQFKPGHSGRPKGALNRRVSKAQEFAQSFLKDGDFQDAVRNILANPGHPHWQWTVEKVMDYAYGKPVEQKHLTSDGTLPEVTMQMAWMDFRQFFVEAQQQVPEIAGPGADVIEVDHEVP